MSVEIRLGREDRIYRLPPEGGEVAIAGHVIIVTKNGLSHRGITLKATGFLVLEGVGHRQLFSHAATRHVLVEGTQELAPAGAVPGGLTEIRFTVPVRASGVGPLYETYHGQLASVVYGLEVHVARPPLRSLLHSMEVVLLAEPGAWGGVRGLEERPRERVEFSIPAEGSSAAGPVVTGFLRSAVCGLGSPLEGEVVVERSPVPVRSIELQLFRVEQTGPARGSRDKTEIKSIQVADGDVSRGVSIPLHFVFPRLVTCATCLADSWSVEFELDVVLILTGEGKTVFSAAIPLVLFRDT